MRPPSSTQTYGPDSTSFINPHFSTTLFVPRMPVNGVNAGALAGPLAGPLAGGFMLFGVRLTVDSMRKSVSLNDLSHYALPNDLAPDPSGAAARDGAASYASADEASAPSTPPRDRKRGIPWTEEEHRLFLLGLQKVGKGDWRGISRNFVKSRTPTQVASHAQKYFIRRSNVTRRRRRSSLFDITTTDDLVFAKEERRTPSTPVAVLPHSSEPEKNLSKKEIRRDSSNLSLELSLAFEQRHPIVSRSSSFASFSGESVVSVG